MSDNRKYYYLKLKENFFDSDEMIVMESMQDGIIYSNILLKLYLRSLKNGGKLMFNNRIPYNPTILAQVTRHSVGDVEKALNIFKELGIIEILDNGAIYMADIQNYIGRSSSEADRKRAYRNEIEFEKKRIGQKSDKCPDKYPPEIEIEIEIEREIEKEKKKKKKKADKSAQSIFDLDPNNLKEISKFFGGKLNMCQYVCIDYENEYPQLIFHYQDKFNINEDKAKGMVLSAAEILNDLILQAIESKNKSAAVLKYKSHYLVLRQPWMMKKVRDAEMLEIKRR
jgi:predicted phage replisome organizer